MGAAKGADPPPQRRLAPSAPGRKLAPAPSSRQLKAKALNALVAGKKAKEKAEAPAGQIPMQTPRSRTPTTTTTTTNRINLLATKTTTTKTPSSAPVVGGGPYAADITTDDYLVDWRHYRKGGRGAGGPSLEIGGQGGSHPLRGMDAVIQVRTLRARLRSIDRSRAAARPERWVELTHPHPTHPHTHLLTVPFAFVPPPKAEPKRRRLQMRPHNAYLDRSQEGERAEASGAAAAARPKRRHDGGEMRCMRACVRACAAKRALRSVRSFVH